MSGWTLLGIAAAGAIGAAGRALLDGAVSRVAAAPWGISAVNLLGSLAAGLLAGLAARGAVDEGLRVIIAVGLLGAFTTFSTWMVQAVGLVGERRWTALAASLASLPVGAALAWAGFRAAVAG